MYIIIKRIFDIICSLLGCILLIPVSILVKLLYIITGDFNSIFLVQKRIGINGKEFNFFKFRTMVPNADEILFQKLAEDENLAKEYKKNKKLKNSSRQLCAAQNVIGCMFFHWCLADLPKAALFFNKNLPFLSQQLSCQLLCG